MLRRKPTAITLTSEDIAAYEDHRLASLNGEKKENQATDSGAFGTPKKGDCGKIDPNDELKPLPGDRARVRSGAGLGAGTGMNRNERIIGR